MPRPGSSYKSSVNFFKIASQQASNQHPDKTNESTFKARVESQHSQQSGDLDRQSKAKQAYEPRFSRYRQTKAKESEVQARFSNKSKIGTLPSQRWQVMNLQETASKSKNVATVGDSTSSEIDSWNLTNQDYPESSTNSFIFKQSPNQNEVLEAEFNPFETDEKFDLHGDLAKPKKSSQFADIELEFEDFETQPQLPTVSTNYKSLETDVDLEWWQRPFRKSFWVMVSILCSLVLVIGAFEYKQVQTAAEVNEFLNPQAPSYLQDYYLWSNQVMGGYINPDLDMDGDGLSNIEEFLVGSNPLSENSCVDLLKADGQLLQELTSPGTCQPFDLQSQADTQLLHQLTFDLESFTDLPDDQTNPDNNPQNPANDSSVDPLAGVFGVTDLSDIKTKTPEGIESQASLLAKQQEYLATIQKIDAYIAANRSYEIYDRNYEPPVSGVIYLNVSLKYDVPLKYVLTLAQTESRFGTDRFTKSGNLTRPGKYNNIYSIGLTDGGQNLGYPTWEAGVEGFGKWYRKFDDRGVSDCQKWRIYNPNGDYCAKVESIASKVEVYLGS
jgi:hypothetical protein